MTTVATIGLDIAKNVFQAHGADSNGLTVFNKQLQRKNVLAFFKKHDPCLVGIESCSSSQYWAREISKLGHEVRLIHTSYVKPFVKRGKTDANDAEAINEALTRPTMRFVPIKTAEQQASIVVFRTRALFVSQRTQLVNALRGHLAENGVIAKSGFRNVKTLIAYAQDNEDVSLPSAVRHALGDLVDQIQRLSTIIEKLNVEIDQRARDDEDAKRLVTIPGIGPKIAMCIIASVPNIHRFSTARHFAAWLGLTPRSYSSGGRLALGRISKMGDHTIRYMLYLGAAGVTRMAKEHNSLGRWIIRLRNRRPFKVAAIAVANHLARVVWALLTKGGVYRSQYVRGE
jgi:transposase